MHPLELSEGKNAPAFAERHSGKRKEDALRQGEGIPLYLLDEFLMSSGTNGARRLTEL